MSRMKTFFVSVPIFASTGVTVQAKNKEEAIEKAMDEIHPSLCWQCSQKLSTDGDGDWDNAEADEVEE